MRKGNNIRLRTDGRYEARFIKGRNEQGKIIYGCCYGKTYEEAMEKRDYQIQKQQKPKGLNLLILGAGGHGSEVFEIARQLKVFSKISFLDDVSKKNGVIGCWNDVKKLREEYSVAIVAVDDEETRRKWSNIINQLGYFTPKLIHPTAYIADDVEIGSGVVVCARATISSGVHLGTGCIVTSGSTVSRNTHIPDWGYFTLDKIIICRKDYNVNKSETRLSLK